MWPLRSSRQRFVRRANGLRPRTTEETTEVGRSRKLNPILQNRAALLAVLTSLVEATRASLLGVVKPHGRLGPLRLEVLAHVPRAAYRRGGLPRPFRRLKASGEFILGRASHLDAFSGYHSRPSLPGGALGRTTGTRAGRPTRSSRTRVRSPQHSNAHDGYRPNCLTTF